jgi:hypothetical protein
MSAPEWTWAVGVRASLKRESVVITAVPVTALGAISIVVLLAAVRRPLASTVKVGTVEAEP